MNAPQTSPDSQDDAVVRTVTAMYLTPAGAYVSVVNSETEGRIIATTTNCEVCGWLPYGEHYAQAHAETCRRLPKRLWPEGGAR